MAITTSASETSALLLDVGGPVKGGGGVREGDDSFARALDNQMQSPQHRSSRTKPEARRAEAGKTGDSTPEREDAGSAATTAQGSGNRRATRKAESDREPREAAPAAVQPGQPSREVVVAQAIGAAQAAIAAAESGKFLPLAVESEGVAEGAEAEAGRIPGMASALPDRDAGRLPGRQETLGELVTLEGEAVAGSVEEAAPPIDNEAGAGAGPAAARNSGEALLQAMRLGLGGGATRGTETADFNAMLSGLRETLPRVADGAASATPVAAPLMGAPVPAAAGPVPPAALAVAVPLAQAGWDQAMGEKVVWMTRQGLQEAQIQLNPRDLGPVEVRVSVHQDQASVSFVAHNPAAREALEAALPRLREMLAESGLNLAQSDVSHQSPQQRQEGWAEGGAQGRGAPAVPGGAALENEPAVIGETRLPSPGAVDYYA